MKVKGPTDGPKAPDAVNDVTAPDALSGTDSVRGTEATGAPAVSRVSGASDAVAEVAARLRAGEITVDQAVERLIDDAIERQMGRALEQAKELEPRLREVLRGFAAGDPLLTDKLRRLTLDVGKK
jgi:hypothetical protein